MNPASPHPTLRRLVVGDINGDWPHMLTLPERAFRGEL